ncbi:hypothetical protein L2Y94_00170 [Luteibacter aegosomatis]|uniref:hypothetical protein n=1 Tax=Luteibacter aegosomatis TaxID=2911537 RepID=UPI001FF7535A|nr:hypothetical protein [Luteibacter aegosomatis]UPG85813.1 hypothetical protein L2Y94_00170 [Luteibacter aegosomatis]
MSNDGKVASLYDIFMRAGGRLKRRGRYTLIRLSRPQHRLSAADQIEVLRGFARETDALYQADTSFHWLSRADYFAGMNDLWSVFLDRELVGFMAVRVFRDVGERIVYIDNMNIRSIPLLAVGPHTIGSMLVHEMLCAHYPFLRQPMSVVFRTQNPSVYRLAYSILPLSVYPRINGRKPRDEARSVRVARCMAARLSPGKAYEDVISVIRGAYHGHIYGRPLSLGQGIKPALSRFWTENVRVDAGDAVLIAGCLKHEEVRGSVFGYLKALWRQRLSSRREARIATDATVEIPHHH